MYKEFDFEKPIIELEKRLNELKLLSEEGNIDLSREITAISEKIHQMRLEIFKSLEPWQIIQIARHIDRPTTLDYIKHICNDDFIELHGDRYYSDDPAIISGFGKIGEFKCAIIGHQKGHNTEENLKRNFGMPHPEGYRKALRVMKLADKFKKPIVIFIDTPGAFPGIGAEERGQSNAIAQNLAEMFLLHVPIVCIVIGEGGSGGALAISIADRIYMLEYSIYSVISAEGCAAILWKDASKAKEAARALKMCATDLYNFGIIDGIIPEPLGGAHKDHQKIANDVKSVIIKNLHELSKIPTEKLLTNRYAKFRKIGRYSIQDQV